MPSALFDRIWSLTGPSEAKEVYDAWATTYDAEVLGEAHQYKGPRIAATYVADTLKSASSSSSMSLESAEMLDAGCGTGLGGVALAELGARVIDGVDISSGMLAQARKTGVYRDLREMDLSVRLPLEDGRYDVLVCVGTLTQAHVGPEALDEFVRVVKQGGFVVATVMETVWEPKGYKDMVDKLEREDKIVVVKNVLEDYRYAVGTKGVILVLQKK
jgi:predicted TPR repeat methyltransferase